MPPVVPWVTCGTGLGVTSPFLSHPTGLGRSKDAVAPAPVGQPAPGGFLKAVVEALGLGPAVVVSPSLSGMYSLPFLFQHGHLVKAYVPVAPICTDKFPAEQYAQVKVRETGGTRRGVGASPVSILGQEHLRPRPHVLGDRDRRCFCRPHDASVGREEGEHLPASSSACPPLQTPALIVYGDQDVELGQASLNNLRHLPEHQVLVLQGAGHACYLDKPEEWHRGLLAFLQQLE